MKEILDELQSCNITRNSNSEYASPALLMRKKNGDNRLCIDYRRLNAKMAKNSYLLPRIDDLVDLLFRARFFISLDLKSKYYQVPLEETSKNYTAFVTPQGEFEWNKMPFSLTNAPRVFQRYMDSTLQAMRYAMAVYLDNILIFGEMVERALTRFQKVLEVFPNLSAEYSSIFKVDWISLTLCSRMCI